MVDRESDFGFALRQTWPLLGDIFLGMAFGVFVIGSGYPWYVASLLCILLFTGAFQFILISLLASQAGLAEIAGIAFMMNSRISFYGIPFVRDFQKMGWRYPIMVHLMSDGNFAILSSTRVPSHLNRDRVRFMISLIGAVYWIGGATLGAVLGNLIEVNVAGVEFGLTALFVTILLDLWRDQSSHVAIGIGLVSGLVCLMILGPHYFILPALVVAVTILLFSRSRLEGMYHE